MATSVTLKPNAIDISGSTSGTTTLQASAVAGTTTLTLPAATDTLVGKATTDTLTNKTLTGAAMNGTLGATTPSTASVTTLTTSSTVTHSGGTANGVAYLDGSKVLTTGSALVFDGTNLGLGVTPSAWASGFKTIQLGAITAVTGAGTTANFSANQYWNGTNNIYLTSAAATLYQQSAGAHYWYNAASGTAGNAISFTQAMTLDASGNLVLGTTSSLSPSSGRIDLTINGTSSAMTSFGTGNTRRGYFLHDATDLTIASETAGSLRFLNNGSERARIDSSGNFMVGVTSTGARIAAKNTGYTSTTRTSGEIFVGASNGSGADCTLHFTDSVAYNYYFGGYNGTAYVTTNNSGGVKLSSGATSWAADSDERLKNIKEPITNAVENLCSLRTVYGNYKTDEENVSRLFLIAQDVQKVYPETVDIGQDEEQTLSFRAVDLIPVLVAAIKEQQAIIQSLTARITALESA